MDKKYYTTQDVAKLLSVTVQGVEKWIKQGLLTADYFNKTVRISETNFNNFRQKSNSFKKNLNIKK